jgi:hypothetical protein
MVSPLLEALHQAEGRLQYPPGVMLPPGLPTVSQRPANPGVEEGGKMEQKGRFQSCRQRKHGVPVCQP